MACIVPSKRVAVTMTKGPGALIYMPPEAFSPATSKAEMSVYGASIDIIIFTWSSSHFHDW